MAAALSLSRPQSKKGRTWSKEVKSIKFYQPPKASPQVKNDNYVMFYASLSLQTTEDVEAMLDAKTSSTAPVFSVCLTIVRRPMATIVNFGRQIIGLTLWRMLSTPFSLSCKNPFPVVKQNWHLRLGAGVEAPTRLGAKLLFRSQSCTPNESVCQLACMVNLDLEKGTSAALNR